jgi:hypothetical protein
MGKPKRASAQTTAAARAASNGAAAAAAAAVSKFSCFFELSALQQFQVITDVKSDSGGAAL